MDKYGQTDRHTPGGEGEPKRQRGTGLLQCWPRRRQAGGGPRLETCVARPRLIAMGGGGGGRAAAAKRVWRSVAQGRTHTHAHAHAHTQDLAAAGAFVCVRVRGLTLAICVLRGRVGAERETHISCGRGPMCGSRVGFAIAISCAAAAPNGGRALSSRTN